MTPEWVRKYIGLEYEDTCRGPTKFDCWGLVVWVYKHEFGMDVGEDIVYDSKLAKIKQFRDNFSSWTKVENPIEGDGTMFLLSGKIPHCGIYIGDGKMLHIDEGLMSCIQRMNDIKWKSRFEGYYRYSNSNS